MSSSEDSRIPPPRKNPQRTCRTITEVQAEWKRSASKHSSSSKSKGAPDPLDAPSASRAAPDNRTRGPVKEPVLPQLLSHLSTSAVAPVPQQITACLQRKSRRPQGGRKRAHAPPSKNRDDSSLSANGAPAGMFDRFPAAVNGASSAETEDSPQKVVRRALCSKRAVALQTPTETSTASHKPTTLSLSPSLPSDSQGPGSSTPKPSRRRPRAQLGPTPQITTCLSRIPSDTAETADPQRNTDNNHQNEPQLSPVKSLSDVPRQKQTRPRKPRAPRRPATRRKRTTAKKREPEAGDALPSRCRRKKSPLEAEPQNQLVHRIRPRFEFHDTELHESELNLPEQDVSSDLSIELSLEERPEQSNHTLSFQEDEEEDEEELPSFLQQTNHKPSSIREGLFVWCKLRKYPFWPAMVKSVNPKNRKASIVFSDGLLFDKKRIRKGFTVPLRRLKPFDCEESDQFVDIGKETFGDTFTWCLELISDYRIRIGCGSFVGSFIEYFTDDISYPVRRRFPQGSSELTFPSQQLLSEERDSEEERAAEPEEKQSKQSTEVLSKKVLPDRTLAARNRANERLVNFIVKKRGVENRLKAVISGQEPSKWLQALHNCTRPSVMEVYLEDDDQVEKVFRYLEKLCEAAKPNTDLENMDRIRFILDVLLPEAIIYAIAGVDSLSLDKAEEKYRRGPCHSNRERQEFDMMIEQQMKPKAVSARPSP